MAAQKVTGTVVATDDVVKISTVDSGTVGAQLVDGGSFSGTITFEATIDGTNWVACKGTAAAGVTGVSTATAAGLFQFPVAGYNQFRARFSTASAGSMVINLETSQAAITKY